MWLNLGLAWTRSWTSSLALTKYAEKKTEGRREGGTEGGREGQREGRRVTYGQDWIKYLLNKWKIGLLETRELKANVSHLNIKTSYKYWRWGEYIGGNQSPDGELLLKWKQGRAALDSTNSETALRTYCITIGPGEPASLRTSQGPAQTIYWNHIVKT